MINSRLLTLFAALVASAPADCYVERPLDFSPSFSARRSLDPPAMARMLTSEDTANIRNMLQDPDAGGDVLFWLYATVAYAVLRVTTEVLFPGKIGKFTTQRMPRRARTPA